MEVCYVVVVPVTRRIPPVPASSDRTARASLNETVPTPTRRQEQTLDAIVGFWVERGVTPTYEELGGMLNVDRSQAYNLASRLVALGLLARGGAPRQPRALRFTEQTAAWYRQLIEKGGDILHKADRAVFEKFLEQAPIQSN